eukprot:scaffold7413_cov177-Ochromonas_danica.AAC.7
MTFYTISYAIYCSTRPEQITNVHMNNQEFGCPHSATVLLSLTRMLGPVVDIIFQVKDGD